MWKIKEFIIAALLAVSTLCALCQTTPNLGLHVPPTGAPNWGIALNSNFVMIDTWSATVCPKSACTLTGPLTAFTLTATTLPSAQCVQTGAGGILTTTGAPCAIGSANISNQTNGFIPLATGASIIGAKSHLDDGITTPATITSAEPLVVPAVSATGLTSGQCVQTTTGGLLATTGAACSSGAGSVSGQATGVIPLATGAAAIGAQSHLDDGVTTPATITTTEPISLPSASNLATGLQVPTANASVTILSVLAFGAKPDAQPPIGLFIQCTLTNGNATISCPSATFTAADVGKYAAFHNLSVAPFATTPSVAQIVAFVNSTHVTLDSGHIPNSTSNPYITWGTDNVPAVAACESAVLQTPQHRGTCLFPTGSYLFATQPNLNIVTVFDDGSWGDSAGGSGAVLAATVSGGGIASVSVSNGGSGYTPNSTLETTISGGCTTSQYCGNAWVYATTNGSGVVTGTSILYPGFGFTSAPTVTAKKLAGDGVTATATETGGTMNTPTIVTGGAGFNPSSTLNWFAFGGGCTTISTKGGTSYVANGTVPVNSSGVVSGTMTVTNNATGCSSNPTISVGNYTCNSGTLGSPVWGQCSNLTPLDPIFMPGQIQLIPAVSLSGPPGGTNNPGAYLISDWDGLTVDNNEAALMAGPISYQDITNLHFYNAFIGLYASNNANFTNLSGLTFEQGAIGMFTDTTDLGFNASYLNFYTPVGWVNGGTWEHRQDFSLGGGGFFDAITVSNIISEPGSYNTLAQNIDNWYANRVWHPEFSELSTDFAETCKQPQSANQRQTSTNLATPSSANGMCLRGPTGAGMSIFARDSLHSGAAVFTSLQLKGGFRPIFQGSLGGMTVTNFGAEASTAITGTNDAYRNATQQEGAMVFDELGSSSGHPGSINGAYWTGSTLNRVLWSVGANGDPVNTPWTNLGVLTTVSNSQPQSSLNFPAVLTLSHGLAMHYNTNTNGPGKVDFYNFQGNTNTLQGSLQAKNSGMNFLALDGTTDIMDVLSSGVQAFEPLIAPSFTLNGGTAMTANQGNGTSVQHSTGSTTTNDCVKYDASGNAVDAGAACTSAPLTGTTSSIGGGALLLNACASGTASVSGATTAMHVYGITPSADPNAAATQTYDWYGRVTSSSTVTVYVCALAAGTPSATTYSFLVQ